MSEDHDDDATVVPAIGGTHISGRSEFLDAAREIAASASRRLCILSYDFIPEIYGDDAFVASMRELVTTHRMSEIRVLVHSPQLAMKRAHRAVELGRKVSSHIHFHKLAEKHRDVVEELLIADEVGYLHRDDLDSTDAIYGPHDPGEARRHLRRFDELWEQSSPATDLRRLGI